MHRLLLLSITVLSVTNFQAVADPPVTRTLFDSNGAPSNPDFFPIAVWLQQPRNAEKFRAAGINLYVGLWNGPTREQLDELRKAGMPVICDQNDVGLEFKNDPIIAGWMHGDEPDNAQSLPDGKGYGPPIRPESIVSGYQKIRHADPSRPVLLNLGQGVAWDQYIGRGVRRNHPEDYPEYLKGCDIASFDIYPVVHDSPEIAGKLQFVARGVERLSNWTHGKKPVWNCIECTHIGNPALRASPTQIRAEVWMAIIRGSKGLIYFVHQFKPAFREAALLDDPVNLAAVTAINKQIRELAPVLNSPTDTDAVVATSPEPDSEIACMLKHSKAGGHLKAGAHLFAVNLRNHPAQATFNLRGDWISARIHGESKSLKIAQHSFSDEFEPYGVRIYELTPAPK